MKEFSELGKLLKAARIKRGLSQSELGEILRLHSQYVSNWERALCAPPDHAFQKIIELLRLDRKEVVGAMMKDSKQDIRSKIFKRSIS